SSRAGKGSDAEEEEPPRNAGPAVAIILDAGQEITSVQVILGRMQEALRNFVHEEKNVDRLTLHRYQNPDRRRQQFAYFIDQGVIVACSDADYLEQLAQRWLGMGSDTSSLADNRKFTSLISRCVGT